MDGPKTYIARNDAMMRLAERTRRVGGPVLLGGGCDFVEFWLSCS